MFYTNMNGLNYRNAVVSNGLASQQSEVSAQIHMGAHQTSRRQPFPNILPSNSPAVPGCPGHFPGFTAVPGAIHLAGEFADRARDRREHNPDVSAPCGITACTSFPAAPMT